VAELSGRGPLTAAKLRELLAATPLAIPDIETRAFNLLDPSGVGAISLEQVRELLKGLMGIDVPDADLPTLARICQADETGVIDLAGFKRIPPTKHS
jgi:Ca2+-binding EF-hand superfamily protein